MKQDLRDGKLFVKGLWGCSCHPFNSFEEAEQEARKRPKKGTLVAHRCNKQKGYIKYWIERGYVFFQPDANTGYLEHIQNLIISKNKEKRLF